MKVRSLSFFAKLFGIYMEVVYMTHEEKQKIEMDALVDVDFAVGNLDSFKNYYLWLVLSRMILDFDPRYDLTIDNIDNSITLFESALRSKYIGMEDADRIKVERFFVKKFYNSDLTRYSENIIKVLDSGIILTTELKLMLIRNCEIKDNRFDL